MRISKKKQLEKDYQDMATTNYHSREAIEHLRPKIVYIEEQINELNLLINSLWFHHQDGSDLMVNKSQLFNVTQNEFPEKIKHIKYKLTQCKKIFADLVKTDPQENQVKGD